MDGNGPMTAQPGGRLPGRYWFATACFDPAAMRLTVGGAEVALEPRPLALLAMLVERPGEVVTKETILDTLWAGRTVTESSLTKCVGRLRTALGDADHALIRTVHGYGYRLEAEVRTRPPAEAVAAVPADAASVPPPLPRRRWAVWLAAGMALCFAVGLSRLRLAVAPRPPPPAAEALYTRGKLAWSQRTPESLSQAVTDYTEALRLAPDFARAYAGLAECYDLLPEYAGMTTAQAYPLAKKAAEHAIALSPDLAEAHSAYAFAVFWGDWDFRRALDEYRVALRLAPNDAGVHHWYATSLLELGERAAALAEIDRAAALDPQSRAIQADRAILLFFGGHSREAEALLRAQTARMPEFTSPHKYLATIAHVEGDDATALEQGLIAARLQHDMPVEAVLRAGQAGLASGGHAGRIRAMLEARLAGYVSGTISAADVAASYAESGDLTKAVAYLSLAIDRHDQAGIFVLNTPEWWPYLNEPGVVGLLGKLELKK